MLKQTNIPIELITPVFDKDNLNFYIHKKGEYDALLFNGYKTIVKEEKIHIMLSVEFNNYSDIDVIIWKSVNTSLFYFRWN